jgi:hypothetical protein
MLARLEGEKRRWGGSVVIVTPDRASSCGEIPWVQAAFGGETSTVRSLRNPPLILIDLDVDSSSEALKSSLLLWSNRAYLPPWLSQ